MTGQLIGLCGSSGAGKDETAKAIVSLRDSYIRVGWADVLKSMAVAIDPYVEIEWREIPASRLLPVEVRFPSVRYVHNVDGDWDDWGFVRLSELVAAVGMDEAKMFPDVRRYLQRLGTEGERDHLGYDVWVDAACNSTIIPALNSNQSVVITDCRFTNEIRRVRELGGEIWQVERDVSLNSVALTSTASSHASEREWRKERADRIIVNNGTLLNLRYSVAIALGQMDRAQGTLMLGPGKKKEKELVSS